MSNRIKRFCGAPFGRSPVSSVLARTLAVFALVFAAAAGAQAQALKVAVMPSNTQNAAYGTAALGEPVTVWGRTWGGTGPYTYVLSFGDGTPDASGAVADPNFIGMDHTYTTAGLKTMTLTVTDSLGAIASRSAVIRVIVAPSHDARINMAIEKGFIFLYQTQLVFSGDQERRFWTTTNTHGVGYTGAVVLAFEENGHLPSNDYEEDIYAQTVQRGLNYLYDNSYEATTSISAHSDGTAVRDPDSDGDGQGFYHVNLSYANGLANLAVIASTRNIADAQATIINYGPYNGQSVYDLIIDSLDQWAYCQGDGGIRGGWQYNMSTSSSGLDGSAQQWPALVFAATRDVWGVLPPAWVLDNSVNGYQILQHANGASGYTNVNSWHNIAKTGGMLITYANSGKFSADGDTSRAIDYIGSVWRNHAGNSTFGTNEGWAGHWYEMYAAKKGLQLQGLTTIDTPDGPRDWNEDLSAWLLGNASLLDPDINPSFRNTNYMFGQMPNGAWRSAAWPNEGDQMATGSAILILTRSVTELIPVAIIEPTGDQGANAAFQMDARNSYHQDPGHSIVSYQWDFDASDGVDFDHPDATGPLPTNPGYAAFGSYTVSLRVVDDGAPAAYGFDTAVVNVVDTDLPPVAVAIPDDRLPAYTGKLGQPIQLDGTQSFDPDGDPITLYEWDTDGDGQFDDAVGPTPSVVYNVTTVGQIGLRVTANGKTSTNAGAFLDVYVTPDDIAITNATVSGVVPDTSADISLDFSSAATATQAWNGLQVRFYDGDPFTVGTQIGSIFTVDLPVGGTTSLFVDDLPVGMLTEVFALVDAAEVVAECDERNNLRRLTIDHGGGGGDVTPPVLHDVPEDFVVGGPHDGSSVSVAWTDPTATDETSPLFPPVTCVPPSGSLFPPGDTVVTCTAVDDAGNIGTETFTVTVLPDSLQTILVKGDDAPGTGGGVFSGFNSAYLSPTGRLLVEGEVNADVGLWEGSLALGFDLVALANATTPPSAGDVIVGFDRWHLTRNGDTAYLARLGAAVPNSMDEGIWSGDAASATNIALEGGPATGTPSTFQTLPVQGQVILDGGEVLHLGKVAKSGGITNNTDTGLWSSVTGLLLQEGDDLPSVGAGVKVSEIRRQLGANDNGETAFVAALRGTGINAINNYGLFTFPAGGTPALVAQRGDAAPLGATPGTGEFDLFNDDHSLNAVGEIIFGARLKNGSVTAADNYGIWTDANGPGLQLLAREGEVAFGFGDPTVVYDAFSELFICDDGTCYFQADVRGGSPPLSSTEDTAFYAWTPGGGLQVVAMEGGLADGTTGVYRNLLTTIVDPAADVAVAGILQVGVGGVTNLDDTGLWARRGPGAATLMLREASPFVIDGSSEIVKRSVIAESPDGGTGARSSALADGNIAVVINFDNGHEQGVFVLPLPQGP